MTDSYPKLYSPETAQDADTPENPDFSARLVAADRNEVRQLLREVAQKYSSKESLSA